MKTARYLALAALAFTTNALTQGYPEKPIRLVVPYPPGGNIDITARTISPGLSELLGQSVVIDNRSGAGGTIGADHVAKSAPDGYTILVGSSGTLTVAPSLYSKNPYHPVRDFAPISFVSTVPLVLLVHPSVPAKNVKELVAIAKPKPRGLTMASAGTGTTNHLTGEMFQAMTGVKFVHVPYKGSGPALVDLMGGQVDLHFDQLSSATPYIQAKRMRALAVTTEKRAPIFPDIPTLSVWSLLIFAIVMLVLVLPIWSLFPTGLVFAHFCKSRSGERIFERVTATSYLLVGEGGGEDGLRLHHAIEDVVTRRVQYIEVIKDPGNNHQRNSLSGFLHTHDPKGRIFRVSLGTSGSPGCARALPSMYGTRLHLAPGECLLFVAIDRSVSRYRLEAVDGEFATWLTPHIRSFGARVTDAERGVTLGEHLRLNWIGMLPFLWTRGNESSCPPLYGFRPTRMHRKVLLGDN